MNEKAFMKTPKILYWGERYKTLSNDAKTLYVMMLDRLSLSEANNYRDEHGAVFIFFTIETIMKLLRCGESKAVKLRKELNKEGLIRIKRQGLNKPDMIYVENIVENFTEQSKTTLQTIHNKHSGAFKSNAMEQLKTTANKTYINKTDNNKTTPKRRFQNFKGEELDHEKLERLEREYLDRRFGSVVE
ncbi:MAG: replication initiator protein A [Defluviitaleaceae bacterium]|nr:replication initiator protein A [Defluviitaleaceae bacterium]